VGYLGPPGGGPPLIRIEEGKPYGQIWGLVFQGIDEDGWWDFKDLDRDGQITNTDRTNIGNGIPDFELGWNNAFALGNNWDISFFFRGAFGHDLINSFRVFYEVPYIINAYNPMRSSVDLRNPFTGQYLSSYSGRFSDLQVEKASFLTLDNFSIGYTVPFNDGSVFRKLRVYLAGNNIFTLTRYKGVDPEVRWQDQGDPLIPGLDRRNTWYTARSWLVGLQVGF
jgi:iron complex outermembrane receptor protein